MTDFFQAPPRIDNTFHSSRWLKSYLQWRCPEEHQETILDNLERIGQRAAGAWRELGRKAEREKPVHVPFDPWGRRIDEIRISTAWDRMKEIAAEEGMIAEGYERKMGQWSRTYQFAKLFLFHPSSAFYTCPLAMADGAARVMEVYGGGNERFREAFRHLTSRKKHEFWTSGQWMTERTGGSDVSGTSTIATPSGDGYHLNGVKWFSSATTAEMALGLARIEGAPEGSKGLTLFFIPVRKLDGSMNGVEILRLKDKLGTWALPTAELQLTNALAHPVGEVHKGIKTVSTMLNITRLYNSVCSLGSMARCLESLEAYALERRVFGHSLSQQPLFQRVVFNEELIYLASFLLTFKMAEMLGKEEMKTATEVEGDLLRLFTPITKLYTAKMAVRIASETVEGFGGAGYVEDTGIPSFYRDAQVFSIWEGATNVLSLDLMRVLEKSTAMKSFFIEAHRILESVPQKFAVPAKTLRDRVEKLQGVVATGIGLQIVGSARSLAVHMAQLYSGLLMLEWACSDAENEVRLTAALRQWLRQFSDFEKEPADLNADIRQFLD